MLRRLHRAVGESRVEAHPPHRDAVYGGCYSNFVLQVRPRNGPVTGESDGGGLSAGHDGGNLRVKAHHEARLIMSERHPLRQAGTGSTRGPVGLGRGQEQGSKARVPPRGSGLHPGHGGGSERGGRTHPRARPLVGSATSGDLLRSFRVRKGLSQADLATEVGVTPPTVSLYETRRRAPSMGVLLMLRDVLALNEEEFKSMMEAFASGDER